MPRGKGGEGGPGAKLRAGRKAASPCGCGSQCQAPGPYNWGPWFSSSRIWALFHRQGDRAAQLMGGGYSSFSRSHRPCSKATGAHHVAGPSKKATQMGRLWVWGRRAGGYIAHLWGQEAWARCRGLRGALGDPVQPRGSCLPSEGLTQGVHVFSTCSEHRPSRRAPPQSLRLAPAGTSSRDLQTAPPRPPRHTASRARPSRGRQLLHR